MNDLGGLAISALVRRNPDRELRTFREHGSLTRSLHVDEPLWPGATGSALYLNLETLARRDVGGERLLQPHQVRDRDGFFCAAANGHRRNSEHEHHVRRNAHEPMVARARSGSCRLLPSGNALLSKRIARPALPARSPRLAIPHERWTRGPRRVLGIRRSGVYDRYQKGRRTRVESLATATRSSPRDAGTSGGAAPKGVLSMRQQDRPGLGSANRSKLEAGDAR